MLEFTLRPESTGDTGPRTVQDAELKKEQFMKLLLELKALLLESDAEAVQLVDDLEKLPGTRKYAGKIRIIKDYTSNYEFDEAADEVGKLIKNMK